MKERMIPNRSYYRPSKCEATLVEIVKETKDKGDLLK